MEENLEECYAVVWKVFPKHKSYHKNKNQMSRWQGPLSCTEVGVMDDRQGGLVGLLNTSDRSEAGGMKGMWFLH